MVTAIDPYSKFLECPVCPIYKILVPAEICLETDCTVTSTEVKKFTLGDVITIKLKVYKELYA